MKNVNYTYNWGDWADHYWLATDKDHHVALVSCMDPSVLPTDFRIDWRWLAGIDERLAEYYSGKPCRRIDYSNLSLLLRQKGFFVIDSYRLGEKSELEYLDPLSAPINLDLLPESFKTIALFFTLPGISFSNHQTITSVDWKMGVDHLPDVELRPMYRTMSVIPVSWVEGNSAIHHKTHHGEARCQKSPFLEFRFLPDSNLIAEKFLPTPHVIDWTQYNYCFRILVKSLSDISSSSKLEFIFRDDCQGNAPFVKMETEPPLAVRFYRQECLAAELLLNESPPNGLPDGSGNLYAFSVFASDHVKKHFVNAARNICGEMGIDLTIVEESPQFKHTAIAHFWYTLKTLFRNV